MAAILLTTVCLSAVWWLTLRNQQINVRLDHLSGEAEEIAYLAGNLSGSGLMDPMWNRDSETLAYMNQIAGDVSKEYNAFIMIIDRNRQALVYNEAISNEDPAFVKSMSQDEVNKALQKILNGEKLRMRSESGNAPMFTVGEPVEKGGRVSGAVLIRTRAQKIESGLGEILWRVVALAAAVTVLTGVVVFLFVRRRLKPLKQLETAAATIAEGDFSMQVDEKKGDPELRELSGAFNTMTRKLQGVEAGRREFVANVSHELRSPITSIKGFAEGMADGVIPAEEQPKYLRLVADESKRLSGLIDDLLALSRLEREDAKPDYTDFDINEMLRRAVICRMNDLEEKKIDISCEFETDPCPVHADSDRIEQVVINLLDNAIKFTPEGGQITLETEVKNDTAEITVRDSGSGVPPEDREKIFDRFFTADRAHTAGKGTGLGLSICKRIMDMHGQSIRLLDTEEGAAFRFTLKTAEK